MKSIIFVVAVAVMALLPSSQGKYANHHQAPNYPTHNAGDMQQRQGHVYYDHPSLRTSMIDVMAEGLMPWFSTRGAKSAFSAIGVTTTDAMKSLLVKILEWLASLVGEFIYSNNFQ